MKVISTYLFLFIPLILFAQNEPNDCIDAVQVCGDQQISLDVSGVGSPDNATYLCSSGENNSLWLRVVVETAGTLGFTLTPQSSNITEDYDFWVFGPNRNCSNLGTSIRCSTTNPQAAGQGNNHTGMRDSETDTSEGPGAAGNSFVKSLDVLAGEVYYIMIDRPVGNSPFSLVWTGTASFANPLEEVTINYDIPEIEICDVLNDNVEIFDFSTIDHLFIGIQPDLTLTYHRTENEAVLKQNALTSTANIASGTYYCRVTANPEGCFEVVPFSVAVDGLPLRTDVIHTCETTPVFDLSQADIIANPSDYLISYHLTSNDAQNDLNEIINFTSYTSTADGQTIFIRVQKDDCIDFTSITLIWDDFAAAQMVTDELCTNLLDEPLVVDLISYAAQITTTNTAQIKYYTDAGLSNEITNASNYTLSFGVNQLYTEVINGECSDNGVLEIELFNLPDLGEDVVITLCPEEFPINLQAPTSLEFLDYLWSTGSTSSDISVNTFGNYSVTVTHQNNCSATLNFLVSSNNIPMVEQVIIQNGTSIEIVVASEDELLYQLDDGSWQAENTFSDLTLGYHEVKVRRTDGCISAPYGFLIFKLSSVITPNGDGLNDIWDIPGIEFLGKAKLTIFDRYGKIIVEKNEFSGGFQWEGTYLGRPLPNGDYWYQLIIGKDTYSGHITVKNQ